MQHPQHPESTHPRSDLPRREDLESVRRTITDLDRRLVRLLAERVRLARTARDVKEAVGVGVYDPRREAAVVRDAAATAAEAGLPTELVRDLFWLVVEIARDAQRERP